MQGLVVVGLIVEEILNILVKCVKGTGSQNIVQGHRVKIPAESVHLGEALCKVRGLTLEEIWNTDINYVKVTPAKIKVNFTRSRYLPSQYIEKKHFARFDGCRPYS